MAKETPRTGKPVVDVIEKAEREIAAQVEKQRAWEEEGKRESARLQAEAARRVADPANAHLIDRERDQKRGKGGAK